MKKKIAAVGRGDEMLAFSCVGVESYAAADAEEAKERILACREDCAVIFLSESLFSELGEFRKRFEDSEFPVLLPVAGLTGTDGSARRALESAADAVGLGFAR